METRNRPTQRSEAASAGRHYQMTSPNARRNAKAAAIVRAALSLFSRKGYPLTSILTRGMLQNSIGGKLSTRRAGFPVALQHDTVLRPEDCGGPVVDLSGKVIGINIARAGRTETFAIPAGEVVGLIEDLKSGKLAPAGYKP